MIDSSVITIIVVVVVAIAAFLLIGYWLKQPPATRTMNLNDENFVTWLQQYEIWYTKSSRRCNSVLVVCRITPIVLGFVIAVVSALKPGDYFFANYISQPILVIILTGTSSLAVAIITQLGLGDLAKTRENGRIACARLAARAQLMFAQSASDAVQDEKNKILETLFQIEQQQADLFAALGHPPQPQPEGAQREEFPVGPPRPYTWGSAYRYRAIGGYF